MSREDDDGAEERDFWVKVDVLATKQQKSNIPGIAVSPQWLMVQRMNSTMPEFHCKIMQCSYSELIFLSFPFPMDVILFRTCILQEKKKMKTSKIL